MPLKSGYSRATVNANIKHLRDEGHPEKQAIAVALELARADYFKKFPSGFLPPHLVMANGRRDRASWDKHKKNPIFTALNALASTHYLASAAGEKPCKCRESNPVARPTIHALAHDLLAEYHKNGEPAACKLFDKLSKIHDLMKRDEAALKRAFNELLESATMPRRKNPVPPSKVVQARNAADLYTRFTGHDALEEVEIEKPILPDVMLVVGDIDGIMYTTVRDGEVEKYVHQFKKSARPLFCVSHDGKQIHLIGGEYDFTERGIVDRT
jgi:hypothetical protein